MLNNQYCGFRWMQVSTVFNNVAQNFTQETDMFDGSTSLVRSLS